VGFHGTHPDNVKSICNKGLLRVGHKLNASEAVDEGFFGVPELGINLSRCESVSSRSALRLKSVPAQTLTIRSSTATRRNR
jgi:hypothetical protein